MVTQLIKRYWPTINFIVYILCFVAIGYVVWNFNRIAENPSLAANLLKGGVVFAIIAILTLAHYELREVYRK